MRWRARLPGWEVEALAVLAETEADGVVLLRAALPRVSDPRVRTLFERHVEDESRHAGLFAARLAELARDRRTSGRPPAGFHGAVTIVELMAYLELTELRGAQALEVYRSLFSGDSETARIIDSVLHDESYHIAYTRVQLDRWRRAGHVAEVASARRWARRIDTQAFVRQLLAFLAVIPRLVANELRGSRSVSRATG